MRLANEILIPRFAELLSEGKQVAFTPDGVSMRPYIEGGKDTVTLDRCSHYRVGDIVLVQLSSGKYVLHRIYAMDGEAVTLMGDGNLRGTESCQEKDIIGKVIRIESPKGHRKPITRGWIWKKLYPMRRILLKVYRHTPRWL